MNCCGHPGLPFKKLPKAQVEIFILRILNREKLKLPVRRGGFTTPGEDASLKITPEEVGKQISTIQKYRQISPVQQKECNISAGSAFVLQKER